MLLNHIVAQYKPKKPRAKGQPCVLLPTRRNLMFMHDKGGNKDNGNSFVANNRALRLRDNDTDAVGWSTKVSQSSPRTQCSDTSFCSQCEADCRCDGLSCCSSLDSCASESAGEEAADDQVSVTKSAEDEDAILEPTDKDSPTPSHSAKVLTELFCRNARASLASPRKPFDFVAHRPLAKALALMFGDASDVSSCASFGDSDDSMSETGSDSEHNSANVDSAGELDQSSTDDVMSNTDSVLDECHPPTSTKVNHSVIAASDFNNNSTDTCDAMIIDTESLVESVQSPARVIVPTKPTVDVVMNDASDNVPTFVEVSPAASSEDCSKTTNIDCVSEMEEDANVINSKANSSSYFDNDSSVPTETISQVEDALGDNQPQTTVGVHNNVHPTLCSPDVVIDDDNNQPPTMCKSIQFDSSEDVDGTPNIECESAIDEDTTRPNSTHNSSPSSLLDCTSDDSDEVERAAESSAAGKSPSPTPFVGSDHQEKAKENGPKMDRGVCQCSEKVFKSKLSRQLVHPSTLIKFLFSNKKVASFLPKAASQGIHHSFVYIHLINYFNYIYTEEHLLRPDVGVQTTASYTMMQSLIDKEPTESDMDADQDPRSIDDIVQMKLRQFCANVNDQLKHNVNQVEAYIL